MFIDYGLISEPVVVAKTRSRSAPNADKRPEDGQLISFDSEWVGGGHNQDEMCAKAQELLSSKYQNSNLIKVNSGEDHRKDFIGHVSYQYLCTFRAIPK